VELKTDVLNEKSRNAMLRLGAVEEGVLRRHILTYSGRFRDTIYYSILDNEWPAVRARLELRLRNGYRVPGTGRAGPQPALKKPYPRHSARPSMKGERWEISTLHEGQEFTIPVA
jgi:hypothetical protein